VSARVAVGIMFVGVLLLVAAVFAWRREAPNPEEICASAADRWEECISLLTGSEVVTSMARAKRDEGIPACVADPITVSMYERCLSQPDCTAFMDCLKEFVSQ
jgi:hypothetical protein